MESIFDFEKLANIKKYERRGGRRQDHATKGNATQGKERWYPEPEHIFGEDDIELDQIRRNRNGVIELD